MYTAAHQQSATGLQLDGILRAKEKPARGGLGDYALVVVIKRYVRLSTINIVKSRFPVIKTFSGIRTYLDKE